MIDKKPVFEHDCDGCIFLGTYTWKERQFDLYFCPNCDEGSVIARFGSDGPEYASAPLAVVEQANYRPDDDTYPLRVARDRVRLRRLIPPTRTIWYVYGSFDGGGSFVNFRAFNTEKEAEAYADACEKRGRGGTPYGVEKLQFEDARWTRIVDALYPRDNPDARWDADTIEHVAGIINEEVS